jgi:hypothetical protein
MSTLVKVLQNDLYWHKIKTYCNNIKHYLTYYDAINKYEHIASYNKLISQIIKKHNIMVTEIYDDPVRDLLEKINILYTYAVQKCL